MNLFGLTELQLSLIAIGVLAVLGVWIYNLWLERRHRQQARQIFHQNRQDVLMQSVAQAVESAQAAPATAGDQNEDDWLVRPVIRGEAASCEPSGESTDGQSAHLREAGDGRLEPRWQDTEPAGDGFGRQGDVDHARMEPASADHDLAEPEPVQSEHVLPPLSRAAQAHASEALTPGMDMARQSTDEPALAFSQTASQGRQDSSGAQPSCTESHEALATSAAAGEPLQSEQADVAQPPAKPLKAGLMAEFPVLDSALESEPPFEHADDVIDCVVQLNAGNLISAPLFWSAQRQLLSRLAGHLNWIGLDENTGQWQRLHAQDANSYRRLVAALQLVDRQGAVAADDLALFCDGVRQLAAHYQAEAIVPVVADVVARANALDAFCAAVDWRLALNLVHKLGHGLPLSAIIPLASAANLQRASHVDDGRLHALDAHGQTQFTLGLLGLSETTAAGLTLTIDVPRTPDGVAAFERMLHLARHLCQHLDAQIVDDQRQPLSDDTLVLIRDKIAEFQLQMKAHKIPAGGRRALRLYA